MSRPWSALASAVRGAAETVDAVPLPDEQRRSWLRRLGVLLIAAKCAVLPLVLDPRATYAFALPKASASRALLYLLLATLAAYLFVHRSRALRWSQVHAVMLPLVGTYLLATLTAVHLPTALFGAPGRYLGLVTLLDNVVLALGVSILVRTRQDQLAVGAAALGAGMIALAYGIVQALGKDPIPWEGGSFFSTLGNSGPFAGYLLIVGAGAAAVLVVGYRRLGPAWRVSLVLISAALLVGVLLRGSRASVLALVPVAFVLVVLGLRQHVPGLLAARPRLVASGALLAVLAASLALAVTPVGSRVVRAIAAGDSSTEERAVIYRAGLSVVGTHPLLGVGPDNFVAVYPSVREASPSAAVFAETSAHSWVLKTATDAGLLGLGALLLLVAMLLPRAWRGAGREGHEGAVVAGVILVAFLAQGVFSLNDISTEWLFWLAAGLVSAAPFSPPPDEVAARSRRRSSGRRSLRSRQGGHSDAIHAIGAAVVGLLLSSTVVNSVSASEFTKVGLQALAKEDGATAIRAGIQATKRDGGRGEPWNLLGAAYSLVGRTEQAVGAFRRAVDAEPYTRTFLTNLADEELKLVAAGQRQYADAAVEHAQAAAQLAPGDPVAQYGYARVLNILGGHEREAAEHADRAVQLAPGNATYLELAVITYERAGDLERAIARQREAVELARGSVASRIRLAQLLVAAGDRDEARALIAPPQVKGADRGCAPLRGAGLSSDGKTTQPRCFRVFFTSEDPLQTDPARTDGATRSDNFAIDGRPLSANATIAYDATQGAVVVQIPAGDVPPRAGAALTVRRIANTLGFSLVPDPTTIRLP